MTGRNGNDGNVVELVNGLICYAQVGKQTPDGARQTVQALLALTNGMEKIKILADYSKSGEVGEDTIQNGLYAMKTVDFEKIAIYGASTDLIKIIDFLAKASGKENVIRFFKIRKEAFEWLKQ